MNHYHFNSAFCADMAEKGEDKIKIKNRGQFPETTASTG